MGTGTEMLHNWDLENGHRGLKKGVVRAAHPRTTNICECPPPPPPGPYVRVHELSSVRVVFGNCLLARESYVCAMLSTLLPLWNVGNVCAGKRNADAQEIPHIRAIHMTYRHIRWQWQENPLFLPLHRPPTFRWECCVGNWQDNPTFAHPHNRWERWHLIN